MILIVDDKSENLYSLRKLLELHRYEVDTADSGEEALKRILKQKYSLIILDVQMPEMDGFEVAENITGYSKSKDIPILFLSAVNIDKRFVTKGYNSGAVDYITKPFDPDILLLKVKTFIRLHQQQEALNAAQERLEAEVEVRKQAQERLAQANNNLETKVAIRTKELQQKNRALEVSNQELKQFASVTSHDLKEPLRKIQVFGSIIRQRYGAQDDTLADYIERINISSGRMTQLIDDLLLFSQLSMLERCEMVDLNELIRGVVQDFEVLIAEKNAEIVMDNLPLVEAVPMEMRQLFHNMISNALKFTREGEQPVITIKADVVPECSELPEATSPCCRITVRDNGIGIDEQYTEKIFTIFQRLHAREEYDGTGIGLAIVKKIVDKHHGHITIKSQLAKGTEFIIALPMEQSVYAPISEQ
jgi:signal transduction histidine kinase